jgi:hypothetical protein
VIARLVPGGLAGVDRRALDADLELDVPCRSRPRESVDRRMVARHPCIETPSPGSNRGTRTSSPLTRISRRTRSQLTTSSCSMSHYVSRRLPSKG